MFNNTFGKKKNKNEICYFDRKYDYSSLVLSCKSFPDCLNCKYRTLSPKETVEILTLQTISEYYDSGAFLEFEGDMEEEIENSLELFAHAMLENTGKSAFKWTADEVEDVCLNVIPSRAIADEFFFENLASVLIDFFHYLQRWKMNKHSEEIIELLKQINDKIPQKAKEPDAVNSEKTMFAGWLSTDFKSPYLKHLGPLEKGVFERKKYSVKVHDDIDKTREKWFSGFEKTEYFKQLSEEEQKDIQEIIIHFIDFNYSFRLLKPEDWTVETVEECLLELMARSYPFSWVVWDKISPLLAQFFDYLEQEKLLPKAGEFAARTRELKTEIEKRAKDYNYWSFFKIIQVKDGVYKNTGVKIPSEPDPTKFPAEYNFATSSLAGRERLMKKLVDDMGFDDMGLPPIDDLEKYSNSLSSDEVDSLVEKSLGWADGYFKTEQFKNLPVEYSNNAEDVIALFAAYGAEQMGLYPENWTPENTEEICFRSFPYEFAGDGDMIYSVPVILEGYFEYLAGKNLITNGIQLAEKIRSIQNEIIEAAKKAEELKKDVLYFDSEEELSGFTGFDQKLITADKSSDSKKKKKRKTAAKARKKNAGKKKKKR